MPNYWNQSGIPRKGWELINVIDIRADGQSELETDYETCMMCGNEKIRYVHIVEHLEIDDEYRVGCKCAEKMTDDYVNPERRERELKNRASRRINWEKRNWKTSKIGNPYLKIGEHLVVIYWVKAIEKYKVKVDDTYHKKSHRHLFDAKIEAFNIIEKMKEDGDW